MTRRYFIERLRRQIYNGQPSDDAQISVNLANAYLNEAIAYAAKQNYIEAIKLDGIAYVNNAFYTTFKNLTVLKDGNFQYKVTLPSKPMGIGSGDDIETMSFVDSKGNTSDSVIFVPAREYSYHRHLIQPQNKIIATYDGSMITVSSTVPLWNYTATLKMVSGGNSSDLDSELNVPDSLMPVVNEYVLRQLTTMRIQKQDVNNDGVDAV